MTTKRDTFHIFIKQNCTLNNNIFMMQYVHTDIYLYSIYNYIDSFFFTYEGDLHVYIYIVRHIYINFSIMFIIK